MRALAGNIGVHVPGRGLREFVDASFALPPQPAGIGSLREFVDAGFSLPPQPAGIGSMVPTAAMYNFPQNSVLAASGNPVYAMGMGCGCGCDGKCGMSGISSDFSAMWSNITSGNWSGAWTSFMSLVQEPVFGSIPLWMVGGGALLVYAFVFSGGSHSKYSRGRRAYSAARSAYA